MKISVSYLGVLDIKNTLIKLDKTDVDYIHVDVMDGKYVMNKTMSFKDVSSIDLYTKKRLDVHFMVNNPLKYIDDYASLNVSYMSFHLDCKDKLDDIFKKVKSYGIKVGLVLNPMDDVHLIDKYLDDISMVLVMGVVPGLPGQVLIRDTIPKLKALKEEFKKRNLNIVVSIDGGVNLENKDLLNNADILVSGSCITGSNNYQETITKLRAYNG